MTGRNAKAKGTRAEQEVVDICNKQGLPSQRVLGSGAYTSANADIKIGVELNKDGSMPDRDEGKALLRAEVKNRKTNPAYLHDYLEDNPIFALVGSSRKGSEALWDYYNQDKITKAVILKRNKTPKGALSNEDYNQAYMVCMGLSDWVALVKRLYELENK